MVFQVSLRFLDLNVTFYSMLFRTRRIRDITIVVGVISTLLLIVGVLFIAIDVPSVESIAERQVAQSTKIYDRTGETLLWEIHNGEKRINIPLSEIDPHIRNATIAIEDSDFYSHSGFSFQGIFRALIIDLLAGDLAQGGSTITQQLVKRALLVPDKKFSRKIKEVVISIKLERQYSKDKILELYLNEIPYGGLYYGVESAAQTYFGKSAHEVTLAEAAYLAAIPNAPTRLSPYGNHRDELEDRKSTVLARMEQLRYITAEEKQLALDEVVAFLPPKKTGILAPHFVMYVREQLGEMYGEENVERLGLSVTTTLDVNLQSSGEEFVTSFGELNEKTYGAKNAALIAIDPASGGILTMIGSRDFFNIEREGNFNVTLAHRQPGSTLKPIAYAAAFLRGYTPETVVFDLSTDFAPRGDEEYRPVNFDDKFRGPVTLRGALAQSLNVPAVKVSYLAGIDSILTLARKMGITSLNDPARYGLSLVLGGGEVSPLELTGAYAVFASGGIYNQPYAIEKIVNQQGDELYIHKQSPDVVLDERIVSAITSILTDNAARLPAYAVNSPLNYNGRPVAAKTGTTNDYRDAWTFGFTTKIAVGVWVGNNDNTPMEKRVAGYIVAPLWRAFMDKAITQLPLDPFPAYEKSSLQKPVLNGEWRGSLVQNNGTQTYIETSVHDILHWVEKTDPLGQIPTNPNTDPQYIGWDIPVRLWAQNQQLSATTPYTQPPIGQKTLITFGEVEQSSLALRIPFTVPQGISISSVDIFIDEEFYRKDSAPVGVVTLPHYSLSKASAHTIRLQFTTSHGERISHTLSIETE